jgi:hypothetical protein
MKSLLLMIVLVACALVAPAAATDCVGRFDRGLSLREARLLRQLDRERDFERELARLRFRQRARFDVHRPLGFGVGRPRFFFSF